MILDVAFRQSVLPCGCRVLNHVRVIGMDGKSIDGVMRLNSDRAELTVQAWTVDPSLVLEPLPASHPHFPGARRIAPDGIRAVVCEAPFEVHCSKHGRLKL